MISAIIGLAAAVGFGIVVSVLTAEILGLTTALARVYVALLVRRLPPTDRDRVRDEWQGELAAKELAGRPISVAVFLVGLSIKMRSTRNALRERDVAALMRTPRFGLSRSSTILKRTFDLAATCVMLVVLLPLMAAIAVAIKLDSPGPVLFRQARMGRAGAPFMMLRFRFMTADAEAFKASPRANSQSGGSLFMIERDPRITRVGRMLRRTGLDEIPNLLNVLVGRMSLIGPRPLVPGEYGHAKGVHPERLHVRPGIAGPWQMLGATRASLSEMVKIDYLYVANWSLWLDFKILIKTACHAVCRRDH